ncbi:MAG: hypothetical protein WBE92_08145 [Steroidobacteraceae bacterium]
MGGTLGLIGDYIGSAASAVGTAAGSVASAVGTAAGSITAGEVSAAGAVLGAGAGAAFFRVSVATANRIIAKFNSRVGERAQPIAREFREKFEALRDLADPEARA